ncbi:c-type cytochrome [Roseivivax sp. CAU 1761]
MRAIASILVFAASAALAETPETPPSVETGGRLYAELCSGCHGRDARGDGPFAELLVARPPDLTGLAARNGGAFPQFEVVRKIDGRALVRAHGLIMPAFGPALDTEPAFGRTWTGQSILTSRAIADLAAYLKSIQAPQ